MPAASCQNHADREAIGICVACRARVCTECVTKVDGINYCVGCLARLALQGGERKREEDKPASLAFALFSALAFFVLLSLLTWGLVEAVL